MSRVTIAVLALLGLSAGGGKAPANARHEVFIDAPTLLAPGSKGGLRLAVFASSGISRLAPSEGADVEIALTGARGGASLFKGRTGKDGTLDASFAVPPLEEGDYTLEVRTRSAAGDHTARQPVKLKRDYRILLVTDKPLYQPGQTIHLRALALEEMALREAAGGEVTFEVEDAKGNKVFKRRAAANAFGVAAVDFVLADEVNMGDFRVSATLGTSKAERTVTVKRYVLPKFKVNVKTDKAFYLPLETIKGTLQADYFFGKPVKDGAVTVKASTFDVQFREFARATGKTGPGGGWEFEIKLPDYFVGTPLQKGNAFVQIEVSLVDPADHEEKVSKSLSVADSLIQLNAVPESGKLVPGIENVLYVLATAPDGSAVEADVTVKGGSIEASGTTNASGFAALRVRPEMKDLVGSRRGEPILAVTVTARDKKGNEAKKTLELGSEIGRDRILLRADKAIYNAGEAAALDVFGTFDRGVVFIDAVRRGQTLLATTCEFEKGRAQYKLPLSPDLFGSIEIHAYKVMANGEIVRDARVVYVQPARDLRIRIETDKPQYAPAEEAKIRFRVTDRDGKGVQSALGVILVDESVYALQDMQPGLEKVYFTLQEELLKPKFQLKFGTTVPDLIAQREIEAGRQEVAKILMAPAEPAARRWNVNTVAERAAQVHQKAEQIYFAFHNFIVSEKGRFWEVDPATGRRGFRKDMLVALATEPRGLKLAAESLADPWGGMITIEDLVQLSPEFSFESWARMMSAQTVREIWQAVHNYVLEKDAVEPEGNGWKHRPGAFEEFTPADKRKDYFGDAFTMERLAKEDPAFSAENVARLTADRRKAAVFEHVRQAVNASGGVVPDGASWKFADGFQARVAAKPFFRRPEGGEYQLADLAKESPCFAAANFAKMLNVDRRAAVYQGLRTKIGRSAFGDVVVFDKEWKWKEGLLETLVKENLLTADQARDIAGRPVDLDAVAREDVQFSPQTVIAAIHHEAVQKISSAVCNKYHSGNNSLPPGETVANLVKDGHLKEDEVRDAWGTRLRLVPVTPQRQGNLGCGLLSGRFTLLSAGPDRQFDTADDVNAGQAAQGAYQPNYSGCAFYQPDRALRQPRNLHGWGEDMEFLKAKGDGKFGYRSLALEARERNMGKVMVVAGASTPAPAMAMKKPQAGADADEAGGDAPIRVREYFPETLLWEPSLITDADGTFDLPVKMADSITTWRLTASANAKGGLLGSTTHGIVVFQDFFVDIDFPVALTQNDTVAVPLAVYNYLKEDQKVTLTVSREDWFELLDDPKKEVALKADQVRGASFRVRVKKIGRHTLTVEARGSRGVGDAIKREVEVVPDGKMFEVVLNDRLAKRIARQIRIPPNAIDGSFKILAKCYPGVFSQLIEGVDGMLHMPHG